MLANFLSGLRVLLVPLLFHLISQGDVTRWRLSSFSLVCSAPWPYGAGLPLWLLEMLFARDLVSVLVGVVLFRTRGIVVYPTAGANTPLPAWVLWP